jgi:hypothetical protein
MVVFATTRVEGLRAEFANGSVRYYVGQGGAERRVRTEFADGRVGYNEGQRGAERLVRKEFADGRVDRYEGGAGRNYDSSHPDRGSIHSVSLCMTYLQLYVKLPSRACRYTEVR